jgi:NAD(P)H-dependent FMN reductase
MDEIIRIGLIYGSARAGRFCDTVAGWVREQIEANGDFTVEVIDPKTALPQLLQEPASEDRERSLWQQVRAADAFVVVTPEYNHGYPGAVKSLIDSVGAEWQAKPVAFVSYGGASGGIRAVEQLRQVFAELHMVTIRDAVSFASAWEQFDESGRLRNPERAMRSMRALLGRLRWWAIALRNARTAMPYAA